MLNFKIAINYLVVFRDERSTKVIERFQNTSLDDAKQRFIDFVNCTDHDGQPLSVTLFFVDILHPLLCHRFDSSPGDKDYLRDKLEKIDEVGFAFVETDGGPRDFAGLLRQDNL